MLTAILRYCTNQVNLNVEKNDIADPYSAFDSTHEDDWRAYP